MKAIYTKTTAAFISENENIFIQRRKFKNSEQIFLIKFGAGKYEEYNHKLKNGNTLEQQFQEAMRSIK